MARRAPLFLRAVINTTDKHCDVLDQLDDTPAPEENVHVYQLVPGTGAMVHLLRSPRRLSGWYAMGDYHHLADVDGAALRDTAAWQAWARAQETADRALVESAAQAE